MIVELKAENKILNNKVKKLKIKKDNLEVTMQGMTNVCCNVLVFKMGEVCCNCSCYVMTYICHCCNC